MSDETENMISSVILPLLAIRGITVFPNMSVSFDVEREQSVAALDAAIDADRQIFIVGQRDVLKEYPEERDCFKVGVICHVEQYLRSGNGSMRVIVRGQSRARLLDMIPHGNVQTAEIMPCPEKPTRMSARSEAALRSAISLYEEYLNLSGTATAEAVIGLITRMDPGYTADYIAQNSYIRHAEKQRILEILDPGRRLETVMGMLRHEVDVLEVEHDIAQKLHDQMTSIQREQILREHLRVIQSELGEDDFNEIAQIRERLAGLRLPDEIDKKVSREIDRLSKQPWGSGESSVIRTYIDAVLELPWHKYTRERLDLDAARRVLDRDHYGLEKVKERIIEFLAVRCMAPDVKGGILCLVGPPGVGKTSVAISVAKAMNRKLARMSLGGVHDEADIRGHRKTYIGAMPGRIMTALTQAGTNNPVLLLDEIDKLGQDYKGDPASALLEALDPEQNTAFRDHFLEIPYDLSSVLFITTANSTDTIPRPLLDRMEVIEITSYTDEEKLRIARDHLLPKQRKRHGLTARTLKAGDDVIRDIISGYTRESGVRQLERELAALCRKTDMAVASGAAKSVTVTSADLEKLLGPRKFKPEKMSGHDRVGVVNGLAWTQAGGEILEVEVVCLDGSGKIELTGNLGDVMRESARAAVSFVRSRCDKLGIDRDFYKNKDIHIHFPEGAVPKDGPSAGITITCALISALTGVPARSDVAMTGEITLSGRVLPIGGLREKTMAALRFGVRTVIIPRDNRPDLEEIDQNVRRALSFVTASRIDDILDVALSFPEAESAKAAAPILPAVKPRSDVAGIRQ